MKTITLSDEDYGQLVEILKQNLFDLDNQIKSYCFYNSRFNNVLDTLINDSVKEVNFINDLLKKFENK